MIALVLTLALAADVTPVVTDAKEPAPATTTAPPTTAPPATAAPTATTDAPPEASRGPKIFVVQPALSGVPPSLAATVTSTVAQAIGREGFSVLTAEDVKTVIQNQADLSLLGGDADPLALSALAAAVGADYLVAVVVTAVDGDTVVQTRLIDPKKSAVLARRELKASDQNNEVLPTLENAARLVLQPLLADGRATIVVNVSEEGANVVVDGDIVGVTPLDKPVGLSGGLHQLTVSKDGFVRFQETVRVKSGDALSRDVRLRPSVEYLTKYNDDAGLYRTLAWVSTGAAVVAGAATAIGIAGYVNANDAFNRQVAASLQEQEDKQLVVGDPRLQELEQQNAAAANAVIPWSAGAVVGGVVFGAAVVSAVYFWAFGDDPDRYADLDAAP